MIIDILQGILLGIIQGLTEFLPVSSSGHLELAKYFLDTEYLAEDSLLMTVSLHFATALSTIYVFRDDLVNIFQGLFSGKKNDVNFSLKIILSMIPAVIVGVFLEDFMESLFSGSILLVGCMLIVTAIILLFADKAKSTVKKVHWSDSILIGIAQAVAIIPGISRSGATISASVILGVDRERAARFSFLMVVPLILGKVGKDLFEGSVQNTQIMGVELLAGFIAAFITGVLACTLMIRLVKQSKLYYFSIYCTVIGLMAITISLI